MKERLDAFKKSRKGQFVQKVLDDRAPNLAILIAWGTLNTLFPLTLGILALAGFVLRDPQRLDQLTGTLFAVLPQQAAGTLRDILTQTQKNAGAAGIISVLLLLLNGTNFFANMESVFDQAYHVEDRNPIMQRVIGLVMLIIVTVLLLASTTAFSLGSLLSSSSSSLFSALPFTVPGQGLVGTVVSYLLALVAAVLMFLLLYKFLPNKPQGWKQTLPGALMATVLFFIILQVFPLYMNLFGKGFEAYATFGIFLLLMFWLYLLGIILVLGAELNAFMEEPGRSTALAATKAKAEKGQVETRQSGGDVETLATAEAPGTTDAQGGEKPDRPCGPLGGRGEGHKEEEQKKGQAGVPAPAGSGGIGGKLIGLVGLVAAAALLRGQKPAGETPTVHP